MRGAVYSFSVTLSTFGFRLFLFCCKKTQGLQNFLFDSSGLSFTDLNNRVIVDFTVK